MTEDDPSGRPGLTTVRTVPREDETSFALQGRPTQSPSYLGLSLSKTLVSDFLEETSFYKIQNHPKGVKRTNLYSNPVH